MPVLLQVNFTMSEDTTLGDLLQLNLHKFEDEVLGIVDKAMKESGMEKVNGTRSLPCFAQSPAAMLWLLARIPAPEGSPAGELMSQRRHRCCCLAFPWGRDSAPQSAAHFSLPVGRF